MLLVPALTAARATRLRRRQPEQPVRPPLTRPPRRRRGAVAPLREHWWQLLVLVAFVSGLRAGRVLCLAYQRTRLLWRADLRAARRSRGSGLQQAARCQRPPEGDLVGVLQVPADR